MSKHICPEKYYLIIPLTPMSIEWFYTKIIHIYTGICCYKYVCIMFNFINQMKCMLTLRTISIIPTPFLLDQLICIIVIHRLT